MIVHQWEGKMFCQFRGPAHSHGGKITEVMSSYNEGFGCYNIKTAHTGCLLNTNECKVSTSMLLTIDINKAFDSFNMH